MQEEIRDQDKKILVNKKLLLSIMCQIDSVLAQIERPNNLNNSEGIINVGLISQC